MSFVMACSWGSTDSQFSSRNRLAVEMLYALGVYLPRGVEFEWVRPTTSQLKEQNLANDASSAQLGVGVPSNRICLADSRWKKVQLGSPQPRWTLISVRGLEKNRNFEEKR